MDQQPQPRTEKNRATGRSFDLKCSLKALIIACIACILLTAGVMCLAFFGRFGGVSNYKMALKYTDVKQVIDENYIGDADADAMSDAASAALVTALGDRWSYYMTPDEYKAYQMYSANEYAGIGVTLQTGSSSGGFRIVAVAAQSPAEKAGLQVGDIILAVDGEDVSGRPLTEVQSQIRAKVNQTVNFTIRSESGETRTVKVDCTVIHTDPVSYEMLENNVGYVQITNFEAGSGSGAVAAVDKLLADGAASIVFDLRGNPGGRLSELMTILDHILPEGDLFVSVDKSGRESVTKSDNICVKVPMSVLVNGGTYSAAEFFAAAVREYDWGTIVGENTTGKGRSQTTIVLDDGSAVHISSNRYLTPNRVDLSEQGGLTPDIIVQPGEDSEVDLQLEAAINAVSGK